MKVDKINNNKAIIVLSLDELVKRKISVKDLKEGNSKAKNFFFDILDEAQIIENSSTDISQLIIEVSSKNDELFTITVTKVDYLPDNTKYKNKKSFYYTVSSNLYEFSTLDDLYSFSSKALKEKLFVGLNSLYKIDDKYFLVFANSTIKNHEFVKTFSVLSEYVSKYYSKKIPSFNEYAEIIIEDKAIQQIQNI